MTFHVNRAAVQAALLAAWKAAPALAGDLYKEVEVARLLERHPYEAALEGSPRQPVVAIRGRRLGLIPSAEGLTSAAGCVLFAVTIVEAAKEEGGAGR